MVGFERIRHYTITIGGPVRHKFRIKLFLPTVRLNLALQGTPSYRYKNVSHYELDAADHEYFID